MRVIKSGRMRWAGHVAGVGKMRKIYNILVVKPEGKRLLGRPRRRCEDNIRMDLREIRRKVVDWIYVAQDRDLWRGPVNNEPLGSINGGEFLDSLNDY
jgi:hypothetical protein